MRETEQLRVFHTGDHVCGYFPERIAATWSSTRATRAWRRPTRSRWAGLPPFRRHRHRPHCCGCRACVAVRIPVAGFRPAAASAAASRATPTWWRGVVAERRDEHIALYQRYLRARHPAAAWTSIGAAEFDQFLVGSWSDGRFLEFRESASHRLLAVAVTDLVPDALSAVYTFYDPDESARGSARLPS